MRMSQGTMFWFGQVGEPKRCVLNFSNFRSLYHLRQYRNWVIRMRLRVKGDGMIGYGHLTTQHGLLHLLVFLESLVLQSPQSSYSRRGKHSLLYFLVLCFIIIYHSWPINHPNLQPKLCLQTVHLLHFLQQSKTSSFSLFTITGLFRTPSINITLSLFMLILII